MARSTSLDLMLQHAVQHLSSATPQHGFCISTALVPTTSAETLFLHLIFYSFHIKGLFSVLSLSGHNVFYAFFCCIKPTMIKKKEKI